MDKSLIYHSFYIKDPGDKEITSKLFIYNVTSRGYEVYNPLNPPGCRLSTIQLTPITPIDDCEKNTSGTSENRGLIKVVKHNKNTIEKKLKEVQEEMQKHD